MDDADTDDEQETAIEGGENLYGRNGNCHKGAGSGSIRDDLNGLTDAPAVLCEGNQRQRSDRCSEMQDERCDEKAGGRENDRCREVNAVRRSDETAVSRQRLGSEEQSAADVGDGDGNSEGQSWGLVTGGNAVLEEPAWPDYHFDPRPYQSARATLAAALRVLNPLCHAGTFGWSLYESSGIDTRQETDMTGEFYIRRSFHYRMAGLRRRRLLSLLGSAGAVAAAGCIDDSNAPSERNPGDDNGGESVPLREGAVVDYPGMVGSEVSVSSDERKITYDDPEATFTFQYAYKGETETPSKLRVSRDLSGETMAAFIAPVYDENADAFEYHVFVNDAFLDYAEWYYVAGSSTDPVETGSASFESIGSGVSRMAVGPLDTGTVGVIDTPPEDAQNGGEGVTGVILTDGTSGSASESVPQVMWDFDYDRGAGVVTITHEGGDTVQGTQLEVVVTTADKTTTSPFEGEVAAGDSVTVDAPPNAVVRVIWEAESGDSGSVIARWEGPET
jgi:hypothetical protein